MNSKLKELFNECICELNGIGFEKLIAANIHYNISRNAKRRLGNCHRETLINDEYYFTISISEWLLLNFNDDTIKNTIMHELLHTIKDCFNHGYMWQRYANMVNEKLGYNIKRVSSVSNLCEKNGIDYVGFADNLHRYKITCGKCGMTHYKDRLTNKRIKQYTTGCMRHRTCGGTCFTIEDLKSGSVIK